MPADGRPAYRHWDDGGQRRNLSSGNHCFSLGIAAWRVDLAIGTAIGSNIVNILLILGLAALLHPFRVHSDVLRRELPLMLVVSLLAGYVLHDGVLSIDDGIFLLALATIWLLYSVKIARNAEKQGNDTSRASMSLNCRVRGRYPSPCCGWASR